MKIAYLKLLPDGNFKDPEAYIESMYLPDKLLQELRTTHLLTINVVQRITFNSTKNVNNISYYFVTDEFAPLLRWWQEPVPVLQLLSKIEPDIIHVSGLNLPLQFRWLRRIIGDGIIIIGEHTGESIWANRNLWLQQFGLRVVDGFIFNNMKDAHPWTKASVILEKQPIAEIATSSKDITETAKLLMNFYTELRTTKNTRDDN